MGRCHRLIGGEKIDRFRERTSLYYYTRMRTLSLPLLFSLAERHNFSDKKMYENLLKIAKAVKY